MRTLVWGLLVGCFIWSGDCCCSDSANSQRMSKKHRLFEAVSNNDIRTVSEIIRRPFSPVAKKDDNGETALMKAVDTGSFEMVNLLLRKKAVRDSISDLSSDSRSALDRAVERDFVDIADLLLKKGATKELNTKHRFYPLIYTALENENTSTEMLKLLVNYGVKLDEYDLKMVIKRGDIELLELLLDKGVRVNAGFPHALSVYAAEYGQLDILKLLMKRGAQLLTYRANSYDEIQAALLWEHFDIVRFLILEEGKCPFIRRLITCVSTRSECLNALKFLLYILEEREDKLLLARGENVEPRVGDDGVRVIRSGEKYWYALAFDTARSCGNTEAKRFLNERTGGRVRGWATCYFRRTPDQFYLY